MTTLLFDLGTTGATPGALEALSAAGEQPATYLERHQSGDFGTVGTGDAASNHREIADGDGRVMSAYRLANDTVIWAITNLVEGNGVDTTLLLPSEY